MRLSTNPKDPTYGEWRVVQSQNRIRVTLDGVEVKHVVEADEENGYVKMVLADLCGDLIASRDELIHERLTGEVRIILEPRRRDRPLLSAPEGRLIESQVEGK